MLQNLAKEITRESAKASAKQFFGSAAGRGVMGAGAGGVMGAGSYAFGSDDASFLGRVGMGMAGGAGMGVGAHYGMKKFSSMASNAAIGRPKLSAGSVSPMW